MGLGLAACKSDVPPDLDDYTILTKDASFLATANRLSGTGTVLFSTAFSAIESSTNLEVAFTLQDGGSLRIDTYATNLLATGLEILFSRSGSTLTAKLVKGSTESDFSDQLTAFDVTNTIRLYIDVHNADDPARVLVWGVNSKDSSEALLDTSSGTVTSPGQGEGTYWGFEMTSAGVSYARASTAHVTD